MTKPDLQDVAVVCGTVFIAAGLWSVSSAAALVSVGVIILWIALPRRTVKR